MFSTILNQEQESKTQRIQLATWVTLVKTVGGWQFDRVSSSTPATKQFPDVTSLYPRKPPESPIHPRPPGGAGTVGFMHNMESRGIITPLQGGRAGHAPLATEACKHNHEWYLQNWRKTQDIILIDAYIFISTMNLLTQNLERIYKVNLCTVQGHQVTSSGERV